MKSSRPVLEAAYARTLLPLARMWRQAADEAMREVALSGSIGWTLVQVGRLNDDVRQTDLAADLDIAAASLVRLLDQMEAAGLVERHPDPDDARVKRVRLTRHGAALVGTIEERFRALRQAMLADISDDELTTTLSVAQRLATRFEQERSR
jgi:MarR family transcriptional regulator for hemolysin